MQTGEENGEAVYHCINAAFVTLAFTDSTCTEAVGVMGSPCHERAQEGAPVVGFSRLAPGCGGQSPYFEVGKPRKVARLYTAASGSCVETTAFAERELVSLVPLEFASFVKGSLVRERLDDGSELEVERIQGEDGSTVFQNLWARGDVCYENHMGDGTALCVPTGAARGADADRFSDAERYVAQRTGGEPSNIAGLAPDVPIPGGTDCVGLATRRWLALTDLLSRDTRGSRGGVLWPISVV